MDHKLYISQLKLLSESIRASFLRDNSFEKVELLKDQLIDFCNVIYLFEVSNNLNQHLINIIKKYKNEFTNFEHDFHKLKQQFEQPVINDSVTNKPESKSNKCCILK